MKRNGRLIDIETQQRDCVLELDALEITIKNETRRSAEMQEKIHEDWIKAKIGVLVISHS